MSKKRRLDDECCNPRGSQRMTIIPGNRKRQLDTPDEEPSGKTAQIERYEVTFGGPQMWGSTEYQNVITIMAGSLGDLATLIQKYYNWDIIGLYSV